MPLKNIISDSGSVNPAFFSVCFIAIKWNPLPQDYIISTPEHALFFNSDNYYINKTSISMKLSFPAGIEPYIVCLRSNSPSH